MIHIAPKSQKRIREYMRHLYNCTFTLLRYIIQRKQQIMFPSEMVIPDVYKPQ